MAPKPERDAVTTGRECTEAVQPRTTVVGPVVGAGLTITPAPPMLPSWPQAIYLYEGRVENAAST